MQDRTRRLKGFIREWADVEEREDVVFLSEALTDDFIVLLTKNQ